MAGTALVFDLDGTAWDSYPAYAAALSDGGATSVSERLAELKAGASVVSLARRHGGETRFIRRLIESTDGPRPYPGTIETLDVLRAQKRPLGVVTSLPGRLAAPLLRMTGLAKYFDVVIDRTNCRVAKPSPQPLRLALQGLGCEQDTAYYVGDSEVDGACAEAASVPFAWASYGYGTTTPRGSSVVLTAFVDVLKL